MIIAGIPAYNEEKTIASVILQAQKQVDIVLVCDDGSEDMTGEIAQRLGAIVIRHDQNLGYGDAIKSLFEKARALNADLLVTLDADGQHNAKEIPMLTQPVCEGKADIAIGSRFLNGASELPMYRRFGVKFLTKVANGKHARKGNQRETNLTDAQCGFRAYGKRALENLDLHEKGMGVSVEILQQARNQGLIIAEVPVEVRYHGLDTSTHNPVSHGISVLSTIIRLVVEEGPMVYLGIPSVLLLVIGIGFGIWTIQLYSATGRIITNVFLISIALIISGVFALFTSLVLSALNRQVRQRTRRLSIFRPVIEERPLVYLGVPALVTLFIGIAFGLWTLERYSTLRVMRTELLTISIALTLAGMFILFIAITLFAVIRQKERM
jgi:glycosyltransferase involved in cell wall biosynthesis